MWNLTDEEIDRLTQGQRNSLLDNERGCVAPRRTRVADSWPPPATHSVKAAKPAKEAKPAKVVRPTIGQRLSERRLRKLKVQTARAKRDLQLERLKQLRQRRRALQSVAPRRVATQSQSDELRTHKHSFVGSLIFWLVLIPLAVLWSVPFIVVGGLIAATVAFLPIGVAIMHIGAAPFALLIGRRYR